MENRIYTNTLSDGSQVKVVVLNGAQYCSYIPMGVEVGSTDLKTVSTTKQATPSQRAINKPEKAQISPTGTPVELAAKVVRKQVLAGYTVINKAGKSIPFTVKAEETPNKIFKFLLDQKTKTYYMQ